MNCYSCQSNETKVIESRTSADGKSVRRRRQCLNCDLRFTTYEKIEIHSFQVEKKDGRVEPYIRDKAINSIQIACRKRSINIEKVEAILFKIEKKIMEAGLRTIESGRLGNLILAELEALDPVAYVRFASVYRDFKTPKEFLDELSRLSLS